jgi:alpha-amylase
MLSRLRLPILVLLLPALAAAQAPVSAARAKDWRDGGTCYEIFVRSFQDSDGDGIGDLKGLTSRLDYINDGNPRSTRSLGAKCIWLMPIFETPGYHGYDISDYYRVAGVLGTNDDFRRFIAEAHKRGIAVLLDMVLNHASDQWPPFQDALKNPASPYRSWFRFAPLPGPKNRWGNNTWHKSPVRDEYYYGFFWKGMPDLNYEQPGALEEMKKVATFWLNEMGADGFRLDAVKYLVEDGAVVEDTKGTHRVLHDYAEFVRGAKPSAFTIGEVFDSTGTLLSYYPDQLDAYFAFEVADSLIAGVRRGDGRGILAPLMRLQQRVPANRFGLFLRNHDQPRTRTELGGDWQKARVASILQLTLPGIPFVYYGEEIGMSGGKPDENIRRPMAWSASASHAGFTNGTPWQALAPDSLDANVEGANGARQLADVRTLVHLREATPALAHGALTPIETGRASLIAFARHTGDETVLVVVNLGDTRQTDVHLSVADSLFPSGTSQPQTLFGRPSTWRIVRSTPSVTAPEILIRTVEPYSAAVVRFGPGRRSQH